ncbi:MAG TPA: helix-turn-helix domain-containing protein [Gaiellaceae bacterium]
MSSESLPSLLHNRWSVPVLAELARGDVAGGRFANLNRSLGVSRESLRRTLAALAEAGRVTRNPGHGHPLRADYVLTEAGKRVAPVCASLVEALDAAGLEALGRKKWLLPVVLALSAGPARFSGLRAELKPISARALALALKELEAASVIERKLVDDYPPRAEYRLAAAGDVAGLLAPLAELARFGATGAQR